jgi:mRNA-degrading endonuclease RelE of RelBE toxin-antitoxin system
MELIFSDSARKEIENLEQELKSIFIKHLERMQSSPPCRHLKHGIPCHVEKVTRQARIVFDIRGERIHILHCFAGHKEYERWYKSFK